MNDPRASGAAGEETAAAYLADKNFSIIERNYRYGKHGEIDIIAGRDRLVIFVEVKSRNTQRFGGALYSIGSKKKQSMRTVARAFIQSHPQYNDPGITFRFDMIAVSDGAVDWIEDIVR